MTCSCMRRIAAAFLGIVTPVLVPAVASAHCNGGSTLWAYDATNGRIVLVSIDGNANITPTVHLPPGTALEGITWSPAGVSPPVLYGVRSDGSLVSIDIDDGSLTPVACAGCAASASTRSLTIFSPPGGGTELVAPVIDVDEQLTYLRNLSTGADYGVAFSSAIPFAGADVVDCDYDIYYGSRADQTGTVQIFAWYGGSPPVTYKQLTPVVIGADERIESLAVNPDVNGLVFVGTENGHLYRFTPQELPNDNVVATDFGQVRGGFALRGLSFGPEPCGDGVINTWERCDPEAQPSGCSDGNVCTASCVCGCGSDADCDDGDPCSKDVCVPVERICTYEPADPMPTECFGCCELCVEPPVCCVGYDKFWCGEIGGAFTAGGQCDQSFSVCLADPNEPTPTPTATATEALPPASPTATASAPPTPTVTLPPVSPSPVPPTATATVPQPTATATIPPPSATPAPPTATPSITSTPVPAITCPPLPQASCRQQTRPRRGRLSIDNWTGRYDKKDRLEFTWRRGESTTLAEFGDPTTTTSYALCVYDGTGALDVRASLAAGSGWRVRRQMVDFADRTLQQAGIRRVVLRSRGATPGAALVRVVGRGKLGTLASGGGGNLPDLDSLPLATTPGPIRAQWINSLGNCWEGRYRENIRRNEVINSRVSRLRARND